MAKRKPRAGSAAWEERRRDHAYIKATMLDLARWADGGNKTAAEHFFEWLELHPEMRPLVRQLDDLAAKVERHWVQNVCGDDALSRKALEDELAAMRAELLGPDPSVTDKVLAGTVVVAHLAFQRAAARPAAAPGRAAGVGAVRADEGQGAAAEGHHQAIRARRDGVGPGLTRPVN